MRLTLPSILKMAAAYVAAVAVAAGGITAVGSVTDVAPAQAKADYLDVTGYKVKDVTISKGSSVKSSIRVKIKRSGKKVSIKVKSSRYSPDKGTFKKYSPKKVKVQVKKGKHWNTIKTVTLKKGKKTVTYKKRGKATYRAIIPTTSKTKGLKTKTVRR